MPKFMQCLFYRGEIKLPFQFFKLSEYLEAKKLGKISIKEQIDQAKYNHA
jgi:hypothetical protein